MLCIKTKGEYDNIIDKISECIKYYNEDYTKDNRYTLYLSNGKRIAYTINENNIPHLLGVKIDNLIVKNILKKDNYYEMLNNFIYESYSIYKKVQNGIIKYSDVFSDYIEYKLDVFKEQLKAINLNDIYFICEYDKSRNYQVKEVDEYTADYYIARENSKGDIILLGLSKRTENEYAVQTSRVIKNDENKAKIFGEFLNGQVITFANSLKIENYQTGYNKEFHIGIDDKIGVIQKLIDISKNTSSIPNTIKNHLFDIVGVSRVKNDSFNKKIILSQLVESMKSNQIFDLNELGEDIKDTVDDEILDIINNYNNYICSAGDLVSDENNIKFSELQKENNNLKEENKSLKENVSEMKKEIRILTKEKEELEKYRNLYSDFTSKMYTLICDEVSKI